DTNRTTPVPLLLGAVPAAHTDGFPALDRGDECPVIGLAVAHADACGGANRFPPHPTPSKLQQRDLASACPDGQEVIPPALTRPVALLPRFHAILSAQGTCPDVVGASDLLTYSGAC